LHTEKLLLKDIGRKEKKSTLRRSITNEKEADGAS